MQSATAASAPAPAVVPASAAGPSSIKEWARLFKATFEAWSADGALRLSAALAYYSIFSIAPLLVITIGIAGLVLDDEAATGQVYAAMQSYVGKQAAAGVEAMVESASKPRAGVVATIVGAATLLLGASGVLGQLKDALNTIWEVEVKKGVGAMFFIRTKFLNFGMVLVIGLLLLMSLLLSTFLATLNQSMESILSLPAWIWTVITTLVSMGVSTILFAMLFKILPDVRIPWRDVWMGAALTAVLFELGKTGLGWYLGRESTADAYGSAGSVVLLLLWVYYASAILLFGAELTQVLAVARGRNLQPAAHARELKEKKSAAEGGEPRALPAFSRRTAEPDAPPALKVASAPVQPDEDRARFREEHASIFSHRLFEPLLKYLEGRGLLLSIEAKEAVAQASWLLVLAAVCCVTLFVAWTMLATALVGALVSLLDWTWVKAVTVAGAVHLALTAAGAALIWWKASRGGWFAETFNELKKDRLWLRGKTN